AEAHWRSAEVIGTQAAFEDHLTRFPDCAFAGLAKVRIEALKKPQVAVVAPPVQPTAPSGSGATPAVGDYPETRGVYPVTAEKERALKLKDSFKECDQCPEMVVVPSGRFTMGSPANEKDRLSYEGPLHQVTFNRNFAVGRFAVTFEEWDACVADSGCNGYRP